MGIDLAKYPKIMQKPCYCVPASVENLLKYFNCSIEITQEAIMKFCQYNTDRVGLKEINTKLQSHDQYRNFKFIFRCHNNPFNSKDDLIRIIKEENKNGFPVIVCMQGENGNTHMWTIFALSEDIVLVFDTDPEKNPRSTFQLYDFESFCKTINPDLHSLVIKPKIQV